MTNPTLAGLTTILVLAAIAPSGRAVLLDPKADLTTYDESKLTRLAFGAAPKNTGHSLRASAAVFEVLELGGIQPEEGVGYAVPVYNAAFRVALGVVRCERFATQSGDKDPRGDEADEPLTVSEFLSLPTRIQEKYLSELDQADRMDDEELAFFRKPAQAGGKTAVPSVSGSGESGSSESSKDDATG